MNDLKELIMASQAGDQEAYRLFLDTVSKTVNSVVSFKVFNANHREDVAQDILLNIHRSLPTYSPERPFRPWLNCIIERKIIDYIRKYSKLNERETQLDENVTNSLTASNEDIGTELMEIVDEFLTQELKKPLLMAKIEGYKTKEIADELGISESATRTRISRAMAKLKKSIKNL